MTPNTGIAGKPSAGSVPAQSLSQTDANPQPGTSEYSPTQTLEEFLYGQDMKLPTGQTAKEAIGKFIQDQSDPRFRYSVDSIIATLPDPIESGLSDKLDDQIDAIQRAAESQGYVLDRFKLPWPTPGERAAKGEAAEIDQSEDSGPATGETAQSAAESGPRSEPGLLLFRDGHTRRALVVSSSARLLLLEFTSQPCARLSGRRASCATRSLPLFRAATAVATARPSVSWARRSRVPRTRWNSRSTIGASRAALVTAIPVAAASRSE